jgi:hypothetical protein
MSRKQEPSHGVNENLFFDEEKIRIISFLVSNRRSTDKKIVGNIPHLFGSSAFFNSEEAGSGSRF